MYNIIAEDVKIGKGTTLKHFIELRKGTVIGEDCEIDSRVSTSGNCRIGDRCKLRYGVIIARGVTIEDDVFLAPHVKFINIPFIGKRARETVIGKGVKIGMGSVIGDGVRIVEGTIIGALSFVRKDILEPGVYAGNPLRRLR